MSLVLGPILQFRGIHFSRYCVSALVVTPFNAAPPVALFPHPEYSLPVIKLAAVPFGSPRYQVWRVDMDVLQCETAQTVDYVVEGVPHRFEVPAAGHTPRMAYVSCNGFSDPKLMKDVGEKFGRWQDLAKAHKAGAYHLLLMGGDQVYSDEMWQAVPALHDWTSLSEVKKTKAAWSQRLQAAVDGFFCNLYLRRWAEPDLQTMFGSVPTIMMWDDHDIMDGWGSYPQALHNCPVYQGIFGVARNYFRLFQLQQPQGEAHPAAIPGQDAFSLGFTGLGEVSLLVLDLRSDRAPTIAVPNLPVEPTRIVSAANWNAVFAWLDAMQGHRHLLVLSSVPVAYVDLNLLERMLGALPGQQELEDDLRDHWRSVPHQQERLRLIKRLVGHARSVGCQVSILSGDVHVGAMGVIRAAAEGDLPAVGVNQLVSSGVVHPPGPALARWVLEQVADKPEAVAEGVSASLERLAGSSHFLIQARNWLALEPDARGRIWANWHVEGMGHVLTRVV